MSVPKGVHAQDRSTRFRVPTCESVDHISFGHKRAFCVDENDLIGRVWVTRVGTGVWNYDSEKWACAFGYKTTR